jgi:hypothetical protein
MRMKLNRLHFVFLIIFLFNNAGSNWDYKRLVTGFPPRRPGFKPGSGHVGFVVDKVTMGQFSPSTSVSPANLHSTSYTTLTLIWGW